MTESIMETAQILLTNLSKQLGLESVDLDDEGCAALSFDEIVVNFEYDPESDLLAFYSDIGSIPPIEDTPRELLESLLKANFFHTGTAGATIGMDRESGFISLFQTLSPTAVEPDRFFSALETFVDLAEGWTKRIPELVSGEEVTSSRDKRDPDYPGDMIRI
ncbi:MAG: type III secretion system chaperone [Verrucomicrobiota bacterium]